jgi:hypothetical protein
MDGSKPRASSNRRSGERRPRRFLRPESGREEDAAVVSLMGHGSDEQSRNVLYCTLGTSYGRSPS